MSEANDATPIRDRNDPGSAAHRFALRRARNDGS
jgi:hypothetical protein